MLSALESAEAAENVAGIGQRQMDRIASMQKTTPWVAAIDGACLGGGLEVAMSCAHRVATSSSKTVLGLPEVMLGLLPGSGGTQRLPKLVGAQEALGMVLTGKTIKPAKAKKMGLVDDVVDPNALERVALAMAAEAAAGKIKPKSRKPGWMAWLLEKTSAGREVMFRQAAKTVEKNAKGKYPAPVAILECVRSGMEHTSPTTLTGAAAAAETTAVA